MIHLIAIVEAKPGRRDELISAMKTNREFVCAEPGCLEYDPLIDDEDQAGAPLGENSVLVVERWRDQAALEAHRTAPHMLTYRQRTKDLVATRSLHILKSI